MDEDTEPVTQAVGRVVWPPRESERLEVTGVAPQIGIDLLRATAILGGTPLSIEGGIAGWRR